MDSELDGKAAQDEEQQGQQVDQAVDDKQPQPSQGLEEVVAGASAGDGFGADTEAVSEEKYRAALAERNEKIAQMEAQIADAFKSTEAAEALAKQIEEMKAAADEQRTSFELRLAGARNVTAAKALLGEHDGDVGKLKAAEPWLFADAAGATGLEPAGAAAGGNGDMKRWRAIARLEE